MCTAILSDNGTCGLRSRSKIRNPKSISIPKGFVLVATRITSQNGSRHEHIHIVLCAFAPAFEKRAVRYEPHTTDRLIILHQYGHDRHIDRVLHSCRTHILPRQWQSTLFDTQSISQRPCQALLHGATTNTPTTATVRASEASRFKRKTPEKHRCGFGIESTKATTSHSELYGLFEA